MNIVDLAKYLYFCKSTSKRQGPPKGYPSKRSEYAVPHEWKLPVDKEHIHAAISYFSSTHFSSPEDKRLAAARIRRAAKKHGVKINDTDAIMQKDGYAAEAFGDSAGSISGVVT